MLEQQQTRILLSSFVHYINSARCDGDLSLKLDIILDNGIHIHTHIYMCIYIM